MKRRCFVISNYRETRYNDVPGPLYCFPPIILTVNKSLFPSEPSSAPVNVRGHNTSSTSISVMWDDVPADDQNGIITSYTITYHSLTQNHNDSKTVYYPVKQTQLTGLKEYVDYSITVFASTMKGNGPASSAIIVITDQDSKYSFNPGGGGLPYKNNKGARRTF